MGKGLMRVKSAQRVNTNKLQQLPLAERGQPNYVPSVEPRSSNYEKKGTKVISPFWNYKRRWQ